ncbi:hypothetical protein HYPSUDRAFT_664012 [Hypholoma sublateritium FD-334 SS-4]|uniref:Uncharacterized protein n=1 Tax=Hypholoma sublateritium (strain FD-334 SS-4) TaxID=945553 RepID=A0A0D2NTA6_HYPSF|nr:hypothetical protein HYPSUDRAFT_664012 [Hypholoma sublateritium FD-334 SS-4]
MTYAMAITDSPSCRALHVHCWSLCLILSLHLYLNLAWIREAKLSVGTYIKSSIAVVPAVHNIRHAQHYLPVSETLPTLSRTRSCRCTVVHRAPDRAPSDWPHAMDSAVCIASMWVLRCTFRGVARE